MGYLRGKMGAACVGKRGMAVVLAGLFPLLCALVYCGKDGHLPADVFLPASYWNDELMYFKQVEAIVECGLPQGWFGYNEAHGSVYPFAAWSPVILLPWVVWGELFGWSLTSPIYANIAFQMIAMAAFAALVRPKGNLFFVLGLLAAFTPYTRYMLSGMPESLCMAAGIWFVALGISYFRNGKRWKLFAIVGIVLFLTLSRPYLGLLFLVPLMFALRRGRVWGGLGMAAVMGAAAVGYVRIMAACGSPYIVSIVETEWLDIFATDGFAAGISYVFSVLLTKFVSLFRDFLKPAVKYGLLSGALYAVTGLLALTLLLRGLWALKAGKDEELRMFCLFQFVATAGMILALFLFYLMGDGSKHLMIFIVTGLLLTALLEERSMAPKLLAGVVCLYFFVGKAAAPYDWQVPYDDGNLGAEAASLGQQLREGMPLQDFGERYDNTVVWLASDFVGEESVAAAWGLLYMVPAGYGINFCTWQYAQEHLEALRSGYLAAVPGGGIDWALAAKHTPLVAETEHMRVYRLRAGGTSEQESGKE